MKQKQETACDEKLQMQSKLQELEEQFSKHTNALEVEVKELSDALDIARSERDKLAERLTKIQSQKLRTKEHRQLYLDQVRQCCIELMSLNVGMKEIEPVIRSVLRHMVNMEVDTLPKPSSLVEMIPQMKGLAKNWLNS